MKKIYYAALASVMTLGITGCDDHFMDWGTPEGHNAVTTADIPLAEKEIIANYDDIKTYVTEYAPNLLIGLGASADLYNEGGKYKELTDANFNMITLGNAMKMDAVVTNAGGLSFSTIDTFLDSKPEEIKLYGHNLIWHTQQKSEYLKSLIKPTQVIETDGDISNLLTGDSFDFEGGTKGSWGSWGNSSSSDVASLGAEGSEYCMHLTNPTDASFWSAQCAYTFSEYIAPDTYKLRFKAKSLNAGGQVQFQYQNGSTYGSQGGYTTFDLTTNWATYEAEITVTPEDVNRIIFNFGQIAGEFYIDEIEFGLEKAKDPMLNVMAGDDSDFEGGTKGSWGSWGNSSSSDVASPGAEGSEYCMHLTNPSDADFWSAQCAYTFSEYLVPETYIISFKAKSSTAGGQLQFQYQNSTTYGSQGGYTSFDLTTDWAPYQAEITLTPEDADRIIFNFGKVAGDYYIDDVKFGVKNAEAKAMSPHIKTGTKIYYVLKSAEEKKAAMEGAMEMWIKGMAEHLADKGVTPVGYDVINEPIMDGSNLLRGVDQGVFNGEDTEPVETTEDGLTLNWEDGHWYWGYYMGKDYGVRAFQLARKYLPAETKLFINDYNLETSPAKLAALIQFVKDIDAANGSSIVDGIGTQMHLTLDISEDDDLNTQIDNFITKVETALNTLKETGKIIRITELDIALGTATPSSYQLEAQYWAYRKIFEKYLEIIPEAQQSGITIWTLSDNAKEHEYWLPDESPNLWDSDYLRKWAYKGVCDGLAKKNIGLEFSGDDYKAYYEKNNTSNF